MSTTRKPSKLRKKLKAAQKSHTARFASAITVVTCLVAAAQEQMPLLANLLNGWQLAGVSFVISGITIALRVRNEGGQDAD